MDGDEIKVPYLANIYEFDEDKFYYRRLAAKLSQHMDHDNQQKPNSKNQLALLTNWRVHFLLHRGNLTFLDLSIENIQFRIKSLN